jgi:hypothetical protein
MFSSFSVLRYFEHGGILLHHTYYGTWMGVWAFPLRLNACPNDLQVLWSMQLCNLKSQSSCGPKYCLTSFIPVVRFLVIFWLWQTVPPITRPKNWTHGIATGQKGMLTSHRHLDLPSACQILFFGIFLLSDLEFVLIFRDRSLFTTSAQRRIYIFFQRRVGGLKTLKMLHVLYFMLCDFFYLIYQWFYISNSCGYINILISWICT